MYAYIILAPQLVRPMREVTLVADRALACLLEVLAETRLEQTVHGCLLSCQGCCLVAVVRRACHHPTHQSCCCLGVHWLSVRLQEILVS